MNRISGPLAGLAIAFVLALAAAPAGSAVIEEVEFVDTRTDGGTDLVLSGVALLRYRVIFKGYVGALYLAPGETPGRLFEDVPKRLELEYFWSIDRDAIADAGTELLKQNTSAATFATLEPRLSNLNALYQDVKPGDRYALTYLPGVGMELAKNDRRLGVVPGADFAAAYFAIWLGENPLDEGFRDALLKR